MKGTAKRTAAIARLTLREALRKRIMLLVVVFVVVFVFASYFLPANDPVSRFKLVVSFSIGISASLVIIAAIATAALAIPDEFADRRAVTTLAKPVRRVEYVAGKILGLWAMLAVVLVPMFAIAGIATAIVFAGLSEDEKAIVAPRKTYLPAEVSFVYAGQDKTQGSFGVLDDIELRDCARLEYTGLDADDFGDEMTLKLFYRTSKSRWGTETPVDLSLKYVAEGGNGRREKVVTISSARAASPIRIPADVVGEDGRLTITIVRVDPNWRLFIYKPRTEPNPLWDWGGTGQRRYFDRAEAKLSGRTESFLANYAKSYFLMYAQGALLIVIAVAGSAFLSSYLSIVFSFFVFLSGFALEFLRRTLSEYATAIPVSFVTDEGIRVNVLVPPAWLELLHKDLLYFISDAFPNFLYFNANGMLAKGIAVPVSMLGFAVVYGGFYAFAAFILATLKIRRTQVY